MANAPPNRAEPSDIAIVGIALRFPGAHGAPQFWANLRAGRESVERFGDDELAARGVPRARLADPAYVKAGCVLKGVDLFDAEFFGFSPKDAAILDPQHRQFLECAWEALEDAGHAPAAFLGPIGVFGGCGMGSYFTQNVLANRALVESTGLFLLRHTGNDKDFLTTRVSYCLDLRGPSLNVQTACSTSLVAVPRRLSEPQRGRVRHGPGRRRHDRAPARRRLPVPAGEILSPDGTAGPFDQRAEGTLFGSGVGIVVLRPLEDALRDGDRIYALIKGSAVNNDGAGKVSYLAPSVDGPGRGRGRGAGGRRRRGDIARLHRGPRQRHAAGRADRGRGAAAGLRRRSPAGATRCGLGSVKANIGHLDTAAGVAGLIKTALALHHGELPPRRTSRRPIRPSPSPGDALLRGRAPAALAAQLRPAARGRDRARRRRHERARRAGGSAGRRARLAPRGANGRSCACRRATSARWTTRRGAWPRTCASTRSKTRRRRLHAAARAGARSRSGACCAVAIAPRGAPRCSRRVSRSASSRTPPIPRRPRSCSSCPAAAHSTRAWRRSVRLRARLPRAARARSREPSGAARAATCALPGWLPPSRTRGARARAPLAAAAGDLRASSTRSRPSGCRWACARRRCSGTAWARTRPPVWRACSRSRTRWR
jgi:3-oxoacyl-(acyl-carrier-protein) synthase